MKNLKNHFSDFSALYFVALIVLSGAVAAIASNQNVVILFTR